MNSRFSLLPMLSITSLCPTFLKKRPLDPNHFDYSGEVIAIATGTEIFIERWEWATNNHLMVIVPGVHAGAWFVDPNDFDCSWDYRVGDRLTVRGTDYSVNAVTDNALELSSNGPQSLWVSKPQLRELCNPLNK